MIRIQKTQSVKERWFEVRLNNVEKKNDDYMVERISIYLVEGKLCRVLSIF